MPKSYRKISVLYVFHLREDNGNSSQNTVHSYFSKEKTVGELQKNINSQVRKILKDNSRPTHLFLSG